jgi:hypothetical protein
VNLLGEIAVRNKITFCILGVVLAVLCSVTTVFALAISGAVRQPLTLTDDDLLKMEAVTVRYSELTKDKDYRGTFMYRGVPLRSLLEIADIQKDKSSVYQKPIDLAVVVTNREGRKALLSWGEIFYKNPGEVLIATSAKAIEPHHTKGCGECHGPEVFQPALDQLKRKIDFPKLVMTNDFYTDRALENVVKIEVIDFKGQSPKKEMKKLYSAKFMLHNGKGKTREIADLSGYSRAAVTQKEVGDGRGYHGLYKFDGVPLKDILIKAGSAEGINLAVLVSAPDGYRALFSYGELFLRPDGDRILVADMKNKIRLDEDGKFIVIPPDDLAADRDVKAVEKIEVVPAP